MKRWQCILQALLKGLCMKRIDHTGVRFGRLVALEIAGRNALKKVLWRCRCDCGREVTVPSGSLVTGNTTSCGCYFQEKVTKHGGTGLGSYNTWRSMMRRCYKPQDKDYKRYGAVGVVVCSEWHEYKRFVADMGEPVGNQTLDRIDPYGNYEPSNCRWASMPVQARNIRVRESSKTGHTGVRYRNNGWYAEITVRGKKFYSKVARTLDEAVVNRKELERLHWGNS